MALSSDSTPFSSLTNSAASSSMLPVSCSCFQKIIARGSNPFSLALEALVAFFCLKGLYRSSTLCSTSAFRISSLSSSVSLPCSSMRRITSSLRSSRPLRYASLVSSSLSMSSESPPVASLRYLAINGIVLPSSISCTVFSTCDALSLNSAASLSIIFILLMVLSFLLSLFYRVTLL